MKDSGNFARNLPQSKEISVTLGRQVAPLIMPAIIIALYTVFTVIRTVFLCIMVTNKYQFQTRLTCLRMQRLITGTGCAAQGFIQTYLFHTKLVCYGCHTVHVFRTTEIRTRFNIKGFVNILSSFFLNGNKNLIQYHNNYLTKMTCILGIHLR